jgi:homoserine kinase
VPETFRTVRVPASSANLGPGFDTLGLAVDVYLTCRFRSASQLSIKASGCDAAEISIGEDNLIWQIARQIAPEIGAIALEIENEIPLGKGLGSSAAAVTAGIVIAAELAGLGWDRQRVFEEAARIERHPDNVGACAFGGVIASAMAENCARLVRLDFPAHFRVAVIVPDFRVPTSAARLVLPESYSRQDAIFNLQRTALLVAALAAEDSRAFSAALDDRLHQPQRSGLVPGLDEITRLRAAGLLGCVLSGAGPSILVFYERGCESVCELPRAIFSAHGHASEILWTEVSEAGYQLCS